jgi:hypothetical protein
MRLLTQLRHRRLVEFRWLTTWEEDAPGVFAPLVGLDVGGRVAAHPKIARLSEDSYG